jgi:hypothetical protein
VPSLGDEAVSLLLFCHRVVQQLVGDAEVEI